MAKSQITDEIMLNALVERGLAERETLQSLLDQQKSKFQEHQTNIAGTAFLLDLKAKSLIVQSYPERQEKARIPINPNIPGRKFDPDDWERWGKQALLADPQDGNRSTEFAWDTEDLYGLVANKDKVYLYNDGLLNTEYLGLSKHALFKGVYKGKTETSPFDLYLSPQQRWLCVSDRGAGTVTVVDAQSYRVKGTVNVRGSESVNTINLALDDQRNLAYITDNQTSSLQILDLETLDISKQKVGLGILGNLVLAPDGKHLFVLSIKPNQGLHYVNTEIWENEKTIKLKGDLFKADSSDPCDLLSMSPDGQLLLIMSYLNEPNPFTPVISVIDAQQRKTIRRYSLKDGVKPFQLAYSLNNPVREYTKTLEEMVMEAELVGVQALWNLKRELRLQLGEDLDEDELPPTPKEEEEPEEEIEEDVEEEPEEEIEEDIVVEEEPEEEPEEDNFLNIEEHTVLIDDLIKNNPESDTLNITPKKAEKIELPKEAAREILDILVSTFQKQVHEDISEYEDIMQRLEEEAEKAREQLEKYDSTVVQVIDLFEGQSLKTVIVREAIVMMLDLRESVVQEARLVPTNCPNCNQRLNGSWDCMVCGLELESPERARKRRIASAEAIANLPMGHVVVPDPQGMRLLQLNPYKYVAWHLDPDQLPADYPVDTLWLPNDNILVTDKDGNMVMELGLRGKVFWTFDVAQSPQHTLNEPVKATYYVPEDEGGRRFLIVDQGNHRILEVNRKSEILKEFGIMGTPGDAPTHLNTPSDVQFTHEETYLIADSGNNRVIEYKKEGGVEHIFGEELNLNRPTQVQRLFNGHTLIVDAGNYRILQINTAGDIVHESFYYTHKMDPEFQVVEPIKMIRLLNKDILIMDEDKMIQVMMHTNKLVWLSKIDDLAFQPKVEAPEIVIDEDGTERLVYKVIDHGDLKPVRLSQKINFKRMQKLIEARLKAETSDADGDKGPSAADKLRALIEDRKIEQKRSLRRELTMDTFQPSEIFEKEGAQLKNIRHYALDRNHNALIRINRKGEVKWHYGFEMGQVLTRPHSVSETRRTLLVADSGNNRIVEISKADKEVILDYRGPDNSKLAGPRSAMRRENGNTLIADTRNKRLIEVNAKGDIVWEFNRSGQISSPQYVEELPSGHILFVDSMLNSVREIDRDGNLRWSYGSRMKGKGPGQLFAPEFATRLENGNTLIADTRNNRVLEVTLEGREVWMYEGDPVTRKKVLNSNRLERMSNGHTLITYNNQREIIEVDAENTTVWYFKMGNDVFQPPVTSETKGQKQMTELLSPYYNPIEKRLVKSAEGKAMWGMEAHITLMDNVQMKSVRASMILMRLEHNGTVIKTFPSPEELLADKFGKHLIVAFIMDPGKDPEAVVDEVRYLAEVHEAKMERIVLEEKQA